jgi:large subunit ribosomal protein L14
MLGLTAHVTKGINLMTRMECADNSGAKELELIAILGYKGVRRRLPRAGVGDVVMCAVKKGKEKMRHQIVHCVIVRQKKEYRRYDGMRIKFSDNAAVLINLKTKEPVGTEIRSVIAKEVVEKFSAIGKIAYMVV